MPTILVVDDHELNRSVLTTLLGYHGHRLVDNDDFLAAVEKAVSQKGDASRIASK